MSSMSSMSNMSNMSNASSILPSSGQRRQAEGHSMGNGPVLLVVLGVKVSHVRGMLAPEGGGVGRGGKGEVCLQAQRPVSLTFSIRKTVVASFALSKSFMSRGCLVQATKGLEQSPP